MATIPQPYLFSWNEIEAASDLDRLRLVLAVLPDEKLMTTLEKQRGQGRDDYPIRPTFNAVIAGIIYDHPSVASLRRELWRNAELRQLCGFDPHLGGLAVPSADAFSRFLHLLIEHSELILEMFHIIVDELKKELPDLGERLAVDSKAIPSFGKPVHDEEKLAEEDGRRDTDADWGTKTYRGTRKDGTSWEKIKHWFGYKLHLLVDSDYELPLAFEITEASTSDMTHLLPLVDDLEEHHPSIKKDADELSADKGYDSADNKATLYDEHQIKPVIDHRRMWKEEPDKPRILFEDRVDVVLYDEFGQIYCQCPSERRGEDEVRELAFVGFEKGRNTLKYRCPAAYFGFHCAGRAECEAHFQVGDYGRVFRVPLDKDRRIFTPIARHSPKWKMAYNHRSAVERVNSRIDQVLGFERHTIRGKDKMKMRMGLALVVMLAMALGRIRLGQKERMRSMTTPICLAA